MLRQILLIAHFNLVDSPIVPTYLYRFSLRPNRAHQYHPTMIPTTTRRSGHPANAWMAAVVRTARPIMDACSITWNACQINILRHLFRAWAVCLMRANAALRARLRDFAAARDVMDANHVVLAFRNFSSRMK